MEIYKNSINNTWSVHNSWFRLCLHQLPSDRHLESFIVYCRTWSKNYPLIEGYKWFFMKKKLLSHTWNRKRRCCRYSARMSSIRTICEKIRTLWPVSFNLHNSLSSKNSLPLPLIRFWKIWHKILTVIFDLCEILKATLLVNNDGKHLSSKLTMSITIT